MCLVVDYIADFVCVCFWVVILRLLICCYYVWFGGLFTAVLGCFDSGWLCVLFCLLV